MKRLILFLPLVLFLLGCVEEVPPEECKPVFRKCSCSYECYFDVPDYDCDKECLGQGEPPQCVVVNDECVVNESVQEPLRSSECKEDSDCVTGGCSGTICQSKYEEPMMTICEYKPEYACYKTILCGCVNGECQWQKDAVYEECVAKSAAEARV